jgi:exodeoxyribonuclease V gamma subunit
MRLHVAERVEPLAERLAEMLAAPAADPMAPDWVAVPSEGMRRWLSLALARHLGANGPGVGDGVAANISFAFPGSLRLRVLDAERAEDDPDPWRTERLAWAVIEVLDHHVDDPLLALLRRLPEGGSRYGRARRVADLFDRYHLHRVHMVRAWAAGHDVDGAGRRLPDHHAWQPHLWRLVRAHLDTPSPPERMPGLLDRLRGGTLALDLPDRLALFGLTLLPGGDGFLDLAEAVGQRRDLHLFLLEPSPAMAARLRASGSSASGSSASGSSASGLSVGRSPRLRADDRSVALVAHPLLRSWGRLARETATLLAGVEVTGAVVTGEVVTGEVVTGEVVTGEVAPAGARPATVLGRLQQDLRHDRQPVDDLRPASGDRSVEIHACHGPTRQVEVLRDAILHCLADDPTLREDDIVVLCPALERFAPLIEAVFGPSADTAAPDQGASHRAGHAPALRYRIADRSIQTTNPVLAATAALLELVGGRFAAAEVLDFVALAPVRERYGLTDDDLARIDEWVGETNVRWGLDPAHRASLGVPASVTTNTWRAATDRLLVGSAILEEELSPAFGDVVPFGVEGDDAVLAGRFAELMWRLGQLAEECATARPITEWSRLLRDAVTTLTAAPPGGEWQQEAVYRHLGELVGTSTVGGRASGAKLDLVDVRRVLADRLGATPGRPDFFRGGITVSSMSPLRWIPHRVVCLLGVDQAAFASGSVDGDDLTASNPLLGDRDPRGEARQSLLEAVLVAGDRLVIVRDGHDVRTNHVVAAAVVVAELRDAVLASIDPEARARYAARLELHHPRQGFDERCFVPGGLVADRPWGFEPMALAGARARRRRVERGGPFLRAPLAGDDSRMIELSSLHRFLKHPVRAFLEQHLRLRLPRRDERTSTLLPVSLAGLARWQVGDRLLGAVLRGVSVEEWARTEQRLGTLPPAVLGAAAIDELVSVVEGLVAEADRLGVQRGPATTLPVDVELGDGTRILGSVPGRLHPERPGPARVQFSRDKPEHRVAAWLDLVALVAHDPVTDWHSVTVSRGANQATPVVAADLVPLAEGDRRRAAAVGALEVAVDCYRRGSREPIPLFPKLSRSLQRGLAKPVEWSDTYQGLGDRDDASVSVVYGAYELDELKAIPAREGDPPGRGGRAERFAHLLWDAIDGTVVDQAHDTEEASA